MAPKKSFLVPAVSDESVPAMAPRWLHVYQLLALQEPTHQAVITLLRHSGSRGLEAIGQMVLDTAQIREPNAVAEAVCEVLDRQVVERMN